MKCCFIQLYCRKVSKAVVGSTSLDKGALFLYKGKKKLQLSHNVVRQTDVNSNFLAFPSTTSCG